jgi:hypothetical protein
MRETRNGVAGTQSMYTLHAGRQVGKSCSRQVFFLSESSFLPFLLLSHHDLDCNSSLIIIASIY